MLTLTIDSLPQEAASTPSCRFGAQLVAATFEPPTTLRCVSPAKNESGVVSLEASVNSEDFSASGFSFCYTNATLELISPSVGPPSGGARVLARGPGIVNHGCHALARAEPKQCRFSRPNASSGTLYVPATISESLNALVCFAPVQPLEWPLSALLNLSVSLNSRDF